MRVIQLVQTLVAGGAESMVRTLCPGLAQAGIDVHVVSVYPSGVDAAQRAALGATVHELGRRGRTDVGFFPKLVGTLKALQPDVVHGHVHTGQYAGRAAAVLAGVPSIALTVHGPEPGGPVRRAVDAFLHARTRRFIVFSESQRRRYAEQQHVPLERIAVIPNGVIRQRGSRTRAEVRAELNIPDDAFVFFSAARLSPIKNQRAAIAAFETVCAAGVDDALLVIAGTGPLEAELRADAAASRVGDRIRFLGFRADVADLYPAMDVFFYPSLSERMPMALGESMLAGLPPLITPWEGWESIVTDGESAIVADGFGAPEIGRAMLRAACDRTMLAHVATGAHAHASVAFDVDAMIRSHVDLYRAMMVEAAA